MAEGRVLRWEEAVTFRFTYRYVDGEFKVIDIFCPYCDQAIKRGGVVKPNGWLVYCSQRCLRKEDAMRAYGLVQAT